MGESKYMKYKTLFFLIPVIAIGFILYWEFYKDEKIKSVYVFYNPENEERLNWLEHQKLLPNLNMRNLNPEIILGLSEKQRKIFDSIRDQYYSQPHLVKENNSNNFYLTINSNESVVLEKLKKVKQISSEEIADYPIISLDSLIQLIPGLEYFQLKNRNEVEFIENLVFHIIEPESDSGTFVIYKVEPIVEHYD